MAVSGFRAYYDVNNRLLWNVSPFSYDFIFLHLNFYYLLFLKEFIKQLPFYFTVIIGQQLRITKRGSAWLALKFREIIADLME